MYPDPLHPAVVHFPIVLMVLQPIVLLGALFAVRRGAAVRTAWGIAAAVSVLLAISAFVATNTGEESGEKVEEVIGDRLVDEHEEEGELFRNLAILTAAITLVGFVKGKPGHIARHVAPVVAVALVWFGYEVGHSGGALVYEHGAASAFATPDPAAAEGGDEDEAGDEDADDDAEDEDGDD